MFNEQCGIAGTVDLLIVNTRGEVIILDWKRSKEIKFDNRFGRGKEIFSSLPDCNHTHYPDTTQRIS